MRGRAPRHLWLMVSPPRLMDIAYLLVGALALIDLTAGARPTLSPAVIGFATFLVLVLTCVLVRQSQVKGEHARLDNVAASRDASRAAEARPAALTAEQMIGQRARSLVHVDDVAAARLKLARLVRRPDSPETIECRSKTATGEWRWIEILNTHRLQTDSIHGLVLNGRDVTARRKLGGKLSWQAFHDPMTGLANRMLFSDRVSHALTTRWATRPATNC